MQVDRLRGQGPLPGGAPPPAGGSAGEARIFRRTRGARALAVAGTAAAAILAAHLLSDPGRAGTGRGLTACGALFLLSGLLVVANFGDRVEVSEEGVRLRNLWRERLGVGRARFVRWEEVEDVRDLPALRPAGGHPASRAFVIRTRSGRRVVFDSLDGIEEIAQEFRRRISLNDPGPAAPP